MIIEAYRNGKPVKVKAKDNAVIIPAYFRWYKPWTWRNGSRMGDGFTVFCETNWASEGE